MLDFGQFLVQFELLSFLGFQGLQLQLFFDDASCYFLNIVANRAPNEICGDFCWEIELTERRVCC